MKLEAEPRVGPGAAPWLVEWMRRVATVFNRGDDAATALEARVTAAEAAVAAAGVTGEFKFFALAAAPAGWVAGNGSTIGNVGSGATLASATTQALFTAWWSAYTDAQLSILTSAGAGSTRGASAAADWAAGKRLTVFDMQNAFVRGASGTNINGTLYPATAIVDNGGSSGTIVAVLTGQQVRNSDGATAATTTGYQTVATAGATSTPIAAQAVRPLNRPFLGCFKL